MTGLKRRFSLLLLITLIIWNGGEAIASPPSWPYGSVVQTTSQGVIVEWNLPEPHIETLPGEGMVVSYANFEQETTPGMPRLPRDSLLLAIPPGASPFVSIIEKVEKEIPLIGSLALAKQPSGVLRGEDGLPIGLNWEAAKETVPYPYETVELERIGVLRGVALARLTLRPVQPGRDTLRLVSRIRVAVDFQQPIPRSPDRDQALRDQLAPMVANPEHIQAAARDSGKQRALQSTFPAGFEPKLALEVGQLGLYRVRYEDIVSLWTGIASLDPQSVHLVRAGTEIAIAWNLAQPGRFQAGDSFLFYAEPRFSRWSNTDVYFLGEATTPGLTFASRSAAPNGFQTRSAYTEQTMEINKIYMPDSAYGSMPFARDGDRWVWEAMTYLGKPVTHFYNFSLPGVNLTRPAELTLWMIGFTDTRANPDHKVLASINSSTLSPAREIIWDGQKAITSTFTIQAGEMVKENNTLILSLPGISDDVRVDGVWVDAFKIRYSVTDVRSEGLILGDPSSPSAYEIKTANITGLVVYDVSNPAQPQNLTGYLLVGSPPNQTLRLGDPPGLAGRRYYITGQANIREPQIRPFRQLLTGGASFQGADLLIIAPAEFIPALTSSGYLAQRQSQSIATAVEQVGAIYDAYGDGIPAPQAIRAFLQDAYDSWANSPAFVLLIGDGTSDPKQYLPNSFPTYIPPYLEDVDPFIGETAADNRFVTLDGDDLLPDMMIGRLPVNSLAEAQTVLEKIVAYDTFAASGSWTGVWSFVADDPDAEGAGNNFPNNMNAMIGLPDFPPVLVQRHFLNPSQITPEALHNNILNAWNAGPGAVVYNGHASIHQWAQERLFHIDDVASLSNAARLPFVLEMTCYTGSFHLASLHTLDESLLRSESGGAVGVWGSTGLGITTGQLDLLTGFISYIKNNPNNFLGGAQRAGKLLLLNNHPEYSDLLDTFTFLGDPSTRYNIRYASWNYLYLPTVRR